MTEVCDLIFLLPFICKQSISHDYLKNEGIHAREWISPAVATYIIHQLVEFPENDGLFRNVDWYIMPVMNPDGIRLILYNRSHFCAMFKILWPLN